MTYSTQWEKFNICFPRDLCQYLQKFHFGREIGHHAVIFESLDTFLIFPSFLMLVFVKETNNKKRKKYVQNGNKTKHFSHWGYIV